MRYIDADDLLSKLPDDLPYKASVKRVLIQAPTADVVSKEDLKDILMKKKVWAPPSLPSDVVREIETRARTGINSIKAEFAYEQDKCVFCGKPYEWVESPVKDTIVEVDGYKVIQTSSLHIHIYNKDGKLVYHASCTDRLSEDELREHLSFYEDLRRE